MKHTKFIFMMAGLISSGCSTTPDIYQVEICLDGREQRDGFMSFMRAVADDSGLEFREGGRDIERDAATVDQAAELKARAGKIIYFGADSKVGSGGFTAGNLGLNPLQIALGMSPTQDASFSVSKINQTIDAIRARWTARRIPSSQSFKPRAGCGDVDR